MMGQSMTSKYIQRYLVKIMEKQYSSKREVSTDVSIYQLIKEGNKRVALLGDAGSGKSTELENCFKVLYDEKNYNQVPIIIPLNTYTGGDFTQYVKMKFGEDNASKFLTYNKDSLVFFLDEFDQVINKESATRQIINFINLYNESVFIISCRSNYYTDQFPEFDKYLLKPFDEQSIEELAVSELPDGYKKFIAELNSSNILDIATIPFFLIHLIDLFKREQGFPKLQTDVLEMVIDNAIRSDMIRLSRLDLHNKYPMDEIKKDLSYISLVLEVLQRNHLSISELNQLFEDAFKYEVITNLNLLKKSTIDNTEVFQFTHNNFNEYLAAKKLSEENCETIIEYLYVTAPLVNTDKANSLVKLLKYFNLELYGLKISDMISGFLEKKKMIGINPSWVNTLGFLSQLRCSRKIIEHLIEHEPEIALKIEFSRITESDRCKVFKAIFNDYVNKKISITRELDFDKLKEIVSISDESKAEIYKYLMNYVSPKVHYNHRYNALSLLCYIGGGYKDKIVETMLSRINDPKEFATVKHICFIGLVELKATESAVIDQIIAISGTDNDYTLSGLYYLLFNSPDVDNYITELLAGIPKSKTEYGSNIIRLGDERYYLSKCLENISSPSSLKSLIDFLGSNTDIFHDYDIKELIPTIVENLIKAYSKNSKVYEYAKDLLLYAQKGHSDEINKIGHFFISTNTALDIMKDLLNQNIDEHYDALAVVFNEETLNLLVNEYIKGNVSEDNVWIYLRHISFRNYSNYNEALDFINSRTNNIFVPEPPIDYKKLDREKLLRKVEILFNKNEFIKELTHLFKISCKDTIKYKDTIDMEKENIHNNKVKYSSFVIDETQKILILDKEKDWSLKSLIEELHKYNYDVFTFEHIFKLIHDGAEIELNEKQINFIKNFCKANFNTVNFKTALSVKRKSEDGLLTTSANRHAVRVWFVKRRFGLELSESMLLDMLSFDWLETSGYCGINYLLKELDDEKISERIKENLRKGIIIAPVLFNHVEYCLNNNIEGVLDYIYACMNGEYIDNHEKRKLMELLGKFDGGREYLKKYLYTDDAEIYLKACELLGNAEDAKEIMQRRMNDPSINIAMASARLLISDQNKDAIKKYVNHIIETKKFNEEMNSPIGKIDTIEALEYLELLLLFYFKHHKEIEESHNFLLAGIMQAFKNIARNDYKNLRKVVHLLAKFIKKHEKHWDFVVNLNRYIDEIINEYYTNYKEVKNLQEAIDKVNPLFRILNNG